MPPGMLWILAGVVLAGAVQDFMILFISMRRDGRSLGELIRAELGVIPGVIALFGTFMIMVILLAVLAMVVVKALAESPWGTFTGGATIPIALLMGLYARYIRPCGTARPDLGASPEPGPWPPCGPCRAPVPARLPSGRPSCRVRRRRRPSASPC